MSGGLVDDYLSQLLGAVAAPAPSSAAAPEPAVSLPVEPDPLPPPVAKPALARAPSSPDEITDDEFEALLDALHGEKPPSAVVPPPAPAPAPTKAASSADEITDDEFEALLDALHGEKPPSAVVPPPAPVAASPSADDISDDEFEALLDTLHGGKPPGALVAAAAVAVAAARASAPDAPETDELPDVDHWRGQERRASRRSSRWLRMRVHQQDYAVELLKVQEVLLPVGVLPMRDTDPSILGVMNLRGVVVPVLDLGLWLGLELVEDDAQSRYVVLEQNGDCLALKVSAVLDVHAIADAEVEPAEHTLASPDLAMLRGVTRLNSQPVILLDAARLLV